MEAKFAEWDKKKFEQLEKEGLVRPRFDMLLAEYQSLRSADIMEDQYGNFNWPLWERIEAQLEAKYGSEMWQELQDYLTSNPDEPPLLIMYRRAQRALREYDLIPPQNRRARISYRISNPDADALLVFFRNATVLQTQEAVEPLRRLFDFFGIEGTIRVRQPARRGTIPSPEPQGGDIFKQLGID
jgi:hypothetical protein